MEGVIEPRKIIQIAVSDVWRRSIIALCNDGSAWILQDENQWDQLPIIPEEGEK